MNGWIYGWMSRYTSYKHAHTTIQTNAHSEHHAGSCMFPFDGYFLFCLFFWTKRLVTMWSVDEINCLKGKGTEASAWRRTKQSSQRQRKQLRCLLEYFVILVLLIQPFTPTCSPTPPTPCIYSYCVASYYFGFNTVLSLAAFLGGTYNVFYWYIHINI